MCARRELPCPVWLSNKLFRMWSFLLVVSVYFICVYGAEVAMVLCSLPGCYACNSLDCCRILWSALSIKSLGYHPCTPSIDMLLQRIRHLPFEGGPVLNARFRAKTRTVWLTASVNALCVCRPYVLASCIMAMRSYSSTMKY
ncbi:uncharacterized protein F5891DRAFT_338912 [Suillus fuscotomentosus]|uniref:Uncharacterized protein n=1 Tax=Suillus fuscotomentosus TaxID=1912939 RepID=A0AAD4HKQ1_9AGAM|nr:uncharacterized protein F5891DRAFT_338912 [Suillus fuscotomentosus]KAG1900072.1 hypothetical protein F5891DRAFT_338912 [Suillus fuscotomentosus]